MSTTAALQPTTIVTGPMLPEPVQVIVTVPLGASLKLIGKGLRTGQVHEPILSVEQIATWLYVVYNCSGTPEVHPIQGPARLEWEAVMAVEHYRIGAEELIDATRQ